MKQLGSQFKGGNKFFEKKFLAIAITRYMVPSGHKGGHLKVLKDIP
jgi:hypothetical protein